MNLLRKGRRRPQARPHPLMQAAVDITLPYVVSTDAAMWAAFNDMTDAVRHADQVAAVEPFGRRIVVYHWSSGAVAYRTTGHAH